MSKTIEFDIEGMTCAACSARIEKVLNRMDGVEATVNLPLETARVSISDAYDDHRKNSQNRLRGHGQTSTTRNKIESSDAVSLRHRSRSFAPFAREHADTYSE